MALYNSRLLVLDRSAQQHSGRSLGALGNRITSWFRDGAQPSRRSTPPPLTHSALDGREAPGEQPPRFPLARRGYDCVAVDGYVADLEQELADLDRELAELRGSTAPPDEVADEIKRVGQQTSAVLMAAHEQREEILRRAQAEADGCIATATANASAVTAQCEERLRDLKAQTDAARSDRDRLLADLRTISAAVAAVADSAEERIPATVVHAPKAT
jgi:DivIVA protein